MRIAHRPMALVADSFQDTRALLKFWLETRGWRVVEAVNGQEAVELTRNKCPDLLLMSLNMPVLDGFEAARQIRERGVDCVFPIVAMSAYPTEAVRASPLSAGCDSFVAQPFNFAYLSSLLPAPTNRRSRKLKPRRNNIAADLYDGREAAR